MRRHVRGRDADQIAVCLARGQREASRPGSAVTGGKRAARREDLLLQHREGDVRARCPLADERDSVGVGVSGAHASPRPHHEPAACAAAGDAEGDRGGARVGGGDRHGEGRQGGLEIGHRGFHLGHDVGLAAGLGWVDGVETEPHPEDAGAVDRAVVVAGRIPVDAARGMDARHARDIRDEHAIRPRRTAATEAREGPGLREGGPGGDQREEEGEAAHRATVRVETPEINPKMQASVARLEGGLQGGEMLKLVGQAPKALEDAVHLTLGPFELLRADLGECAAQLIIEGDEAVDARNPGIRDAAVDLAREIDELIGLAHHVFNPNSSVGVVRRETSDTTPHPGVTIRRRCRSRGSRQS